MGRRASSGRIRCRQTVVVSSPIHATSANLVLALLFCFFVLQNRHNCDAFVGSASLSVSTSRQKGRQRYRHAGVSLAPLLLRGQGTSRGKVSTTALNLVFHRLSDDCIAALNVAQEQASLMQQEEITNPIMLLGIIDSPQRAKSTLDKFGITWQAVRQVLNNLIVSSTMSTPRLSDFTNAKSELPYSKELQATLNEAGKLSNLMGSATINSEHILLALFEYKEVNGQPQASGRGDTCEAMEIVEHIDATLDGEEICQSLLRTLLDERVEGNLKAKELAQATDSETKPASILLEFGIDLTQRAREGKLDLVHERDEEIWNCLRILVRRRKKNACLIGEPGVGKSAIVEGIAQVLVSDECPPLLKGHRIVALELGTLIAGTKYRGEFEERIRAIIKEVTDEGAIPTILFLDEIHTLVGSGSTDSGGMNAAGLLKPALARGELQILGATTISEFQKYIAKDAALERRLQSVLVKEPTVDQTINILQALQPSYERHHGVKFMWESIVAAVKLSDRYIGDRFLPDKAIDILDEAGALCHLRKSSGGTHIVDAQMVANIVSEWSNIPVGKLSDDDMDRLQGLEEEISSRVKGQERAVKTVVKAVRRARSGMRNPRRPIASLLMCGVTGTGKTELCKTLADTYFGSEKDMIRIDMSEYMEKHSVSRLTGPPPGYEGYVSISFNHFLH
jgi:ATP-dependent Clp protease ATP-binding subunit ClpC